MSLVTRYLRNARTLNASGRFLWLLVLLGACQVSGMSTAEPARDMGPADPVITDAPISSGDVDRAAQIFAQALEAFAVGRLDVAAELADQVIDEYPSSAVSGRALILRAQVARDGKDAATADASAERYISLLAADDSRIAAARLLQAEAFVDDASARVDRLMRIPHTVPRTELDRATRMAREAVGTLVEADVVSVLSRTSDDAPLRWVLEIRAGVLALEAGDDAAATAFAERALVLGAAGPDSVIAEGLRRGELPGDGGRQRVTTLEIATVLPTGGPPALANYAALVAEGVEVAAASVLGRRFDVRVTAKDDQADPALAGTLVREIERGSAVGIVGFLEDASLEAGGRARTRDLPLISPTARSASRAGDGAYSLEGPDPLAAASMAHYAADEGYLRVAIVHSDALESVAEADAFEATMQTLGIPVVGRYGYPLGVTNFEDQILGARDALRRAEIAALELGEEDTLHVELLEPVAVFVPIPTEDVELVAPQITHYALDTLAIAVLGTSAWTDPQVLADVDSRHTNGVVATAPEGRGTGSAGAGRFREAYEAHFQRSLVSSVPAVGYDAALLLLEGLRPGPSSRRQLRANMEQLRDIEGATGVFSVIDGIVVRRSEVVYIDNGTLIPIG